MKIKKKFLTLSIRHQISSVIVILTIICLLLILSLFSLYTNIMINIHIRKRKQYYYQKYQDIVDSKIKFQSFLLYQHEQLIKGFNSQIYYYGLSQKDLYDTMISNKEEFIKYYKETTEEYYQNNKDNNNYYLYSFSNDPFKDGQVYELLLSTHSSIDNQLNILRNLRIPYLGEEFKIVNEYIFVRLAEQSLYSMNRTRIKEIDEISGGNFSDFYDDLINNYVEKYKNLMNAYKKGELDFMDIFFSDKYYLFQNYVNTTFIKEKYKNNVRMYLNDISSHFHFIDYISEKTFVTDNGDKNRVIFLEQNTIIPDYINIIFFKIQNFSDIDIIPVFYGNNTIMSVNLCYAFLYKQMILLNLTEEKNDFTDEKLNEIYNNLKKGISNIGDCILNKKYNFDIKQNVNDILNTKFDKYYSKTNSREFSLFKLSDTILGEDFISIKYTFPDCPILLDFKPTFFTMEQLNIYNFKNFYEPKHYINGMFSFFYNCQFMIILILEYLWALICIYLIFRLKRLFIEVIEPINNLIKVINKLEVKEENMLKYESDDDINELFQLCNNLLIGKYKQKIMHFSENERLYKNENINMNDFNNLKLNIKLIEDMIENKNEYNIKGDEIITFKLDDHLNNKRIVIHNNNLLQKNGMRKTALLKRKLDKPNNDIGVISNIQSSIKKTRSITQALNFLNKKLSFDINLINNTDYLISTENRSEEDILEIQILLNYKHLYDIVDLAFNYDYKYDKKFISKKSQLLYKSNIHDYNKYSKLRAKNKLSPYKHIIDEKGDENSLYEKEIKDASKIKIEEFDKSVITAYETKDLLFIWYEEAKYFKGVEFLQNNHAKELNNLFKLIFGNDNRKQNNQLINNNLINNSIQHKKTVSKKQMNKFN